MKPDISIIIPTYNRANLISETLDSIRNQTYKNWECIIIDDHSTDNTDKLISSSLEDKRFSYFKRPENLKKGANSCRNYGYTKSRGAYILWFDSDDILHPCALELCLKYLLTEKIDYCRFERDIFYNSFDKNLISNIIVHTNHIYLDYSDLDKILMNKIAMGTCNVMWKRYSIGMEKFNEEIEYADEWEFFSRLISNKLTGISLHTILLYVRKHDNSTTYEFRKNNALRVNSKKEAIRLVAKNLYLKQLLSSVLIKYLAGLAIGFRDYNLLNEILTISKTPPKIKLYLKLKFYLFPGWKVYKRMLKKIS